MRRVFIASLYAICVAALSNVALNKPVLETFSGDGSNATTASSSVGWFSTAFSDFPDHSLYPETILIDLESVYNISAVAFVNASCPPQNFSIFVSLAGDASFSLVGSSLTFSPTLARLMWLRVEFRYFASTALLACK